MADSTTSTVTSAFTSGSINVGGLGNGTDFNTLIDGLVKAEQVTTTRLQAWKSEWTEKVSYFQALNTKMLTLKTTLEGMDTMNEFMAKTVSSTNESALTASADSTAEVAAHSIIVGQLAKNDILTTTTGVSSITTSLTSNATSISFSYAGQTYSMSNIGAGTTLQGLVNFINNNAIANGKIRATTIFDGSVYHLQIYGMGQGATNQVVLNSMGSLSFTAGSFTNTQDAQSSKMKVDGYPVGATNWITRDSNTVTDIIPGITLNLKEADANTAITVGVTTNSDGIKANISTFISQVNEVRTMIKQMTQVSSASGSTVGSVLTGNYGVQLISSQLKDVTADQGIGFAAYDSANGGTGDYYSVLSQLGITTDANEASTTSGLLILDETKLDEALASRPTEVAQLFASYYAGESQSQNFSYLDHIDGKTKAGSYDVKIITSAAGISSATINGVRAGIDGWTVTGLSGDMAGLVIQLDNHTANKTFTGKVNIKLGKAGEMVEKLKQLTNSNDGPLAILEENYGDITKSIDDKIAKEATRLADLKSTLQAKFARLDALLQTLTQQQTQLTSTIASLTSS
jgi:flagellar hook-associated protein 2